MTTSLLHALAQVSSIFLCASVLANSNVDSQEASSADDSEIESKHILQNQLNTGGILTWNYNRNSTGRPDGHSTTFGVDLRDNTTWTYWLNKLENEINLELRYTKTPIITPFIKSNDRLRWTLKYNRSFARARWLGFYGQSLLQTSLLRGEDVRPEATTYLIRERNGTVTPTTTSRLFLQDPFRPMNLRQSGGLSATHSWSQLAKVQILTGFAVREFFANGQRTLNDDSGTPEIEVQALQTSFEFGSLVSFEFKGETGDQRLYYVLRADAMTPLISSQSFDGRSNLASSNIEIQAEFGARIQSWLTIRYLLGAARNPQVFDGQQFETGIEFKLSFDYLYNFRS